MFFTTVTIGSRSSHENKKGTRATEDPGEVQQSARGVYSPACDLWNDNGPRVSIVALGQAYPDHGEVLPSFIVGVFVAPQDIQADIPL